VAAIGNSTSTQSATRRQLRPQSCSKSAGIMCGRLLCLGRLGGAVAV
jgi:hypothetical protein